jgi:glucosamine--fructose-6-phosphate aminotransferase (isomerizing)
VTPPAVAATSRMRDEIFEQPEALSRTLERLADVRQRLRRLRNDVDRVLFFARGSSDNAAIYARYVCEVVVGIPAALGAPSVATVYHRSLDLRRTLVVTISQSGRTEEMVDIADWARRCGATTLAVTNTDGSPLTDIVDLPVVTDAGVERAVPATKTFTAALLAIAGVAEALSGGRPFGDALQAVPEQASELLLRAPDVDRLTPLLASCTSLTVVGRGFSLATAVEIALKVEEACRLPAAGLSSADLQHGPLGAVHEGTALLVTAAAGGPTVAGLTALAVRARQSGALTLGIGGDARLRAACDAAVAGADLPESIAPIVDVIPGQLLTESLARLLGHDPDAPRGLTKVTQTT